MHMCQRAVAATGSRATLPELQGTGYDNHARMQAKLQPGDIQLCYNHTMLHARSTYQDGPNPGEQRHLVRLWLAPHDDRELPAEYASFAGFTEPGSRGGIVPAPGARLHVPLDKY